MKRSALMLLVGLLSACGSEPSATDVPSGPDVSTPYPIDRGGSDPGAPATYKGLPLRLFDNGQPAVEPVNGVIGIVCIGMSNATQECSDFIQRFPAQYASAANPAIRIVDCAVGGHAIEKWIDPAYDATLWRRCIDTRLPAAGITLSQVRVIWHKAANQFTTGSGGAPLPLYPASGSDYEAFMRNLTAFAARVNNFFPAVRAVYTTSRSYGGFAGSVSRGEPLSYEEGHALNTWLANNKRVADVWYGWGPYIWAPDCATGVTNGAGVCYQRSDYVSDGVHPSLSGREKVSAQLHRFFMTQSWYRR